MADGIKLVVDIHEAAVLFDSLDIKKQNNLVKSAIRLSLSPILKEAQSNFRSKFKQGSGEGLKSLGMQLFRRRNGGAIGARLSLRKGELKKLRLYKKGNQNKKAPQLQKYQGWYMRFLDVGTAARKTKKGKNLGKITPSLYFSAPSSAREGKAINDLSDNIILALNKSIKLGKL